MVDIRAKIRLRPIRIGFLVRPTDKSSIRSIMRYCCTIWGGVYNPIIPVFRKPPRAWASEPFDRVRGLAVARGYIRFFEPDVYVEAERGLLESVGLRELRTLPVIYPDARGLDDLLKPEPHRDWCDPAFGLNVRDIHEHIYKTEEQFIRRDSRQNITVPHQRDSCAAEAIFGVFPTDAAVSYISEGYAEVFRPIEVVAGPEAWKKLFLENAQTPLRATGYGLDAKRFWNHDSVIFVFDPTQTTDLIDVWNLRLEPRPIIPVPVDWFESLTDPIFDILNSTHRRIQGNPSNLMHRATIEFSRSIKNEEANAFVAKIKGGLPTGALVVKTWRNRIWVDHGDDHFHRDVRLEVTAAERDITLKFGDKDSRTTSFETLSPDFARRYGGRDHRWVNALVPSRFSSEVATILPYNTFDPDWPYLGMGRERVRVGSEGWIYSQRYKDDGQWVQLLTQDQAISGFLFRYGVESKLSEPGQIAKQMLEHLGGLWGVHLLADVETLQLLNKMAGGVRTRTRQGDTIEESFELRTALASNWVSLIAKRKQSQRVPALSLEDFTSRKIIQLGVETECSICRARNWSSIDMLSYEMKCSRCLSLYLFPQANLKPKNGNWFYRVSGPFSVPDYGRGAYSALLTLRVIDQFSLSSKGMTFSTAMELKIAGKNCEVDFLAIRRPRDRDDSPEPEMIIGETKSFGNGPLLTAGDLEKLKTVAAKIPGCFVVVSVLRDDFTASEKKLLEQLVRWGRRPDSNDRQSNPVVLLTSNELMFEHMLSATWKELGGRHEKFGDYDDTKDLRSIANATQQIYLNLPSHGEWRRSRWEAKAKKTPAKQAI